MHPLASDYRIIDPSQWNAYQIRAFGPLIVDLTLRIAALKRSDRAEAHRIADKLNLCCRHPCIITVAHGIRYYLAESRCRSRVCPRCSRIRARSLASRIATLVRQMDCPRFLTLTIRSSDRPLRDQVKHLRRRFAAMRRLRGWGNHVLGGVYTIEITFNARTAQWHPHLHAIIDGSYWPHSELLRLWETVVHDQAGVDIRAVHGVRKLANYLACYVAKSCDLGNLDPDHLAEWAVETHGLRLAQTFGRLQTSKPQSDDLEPVPCRLVEVDVNDIAYCAAHGWLNCASLLEALEPRRGARPDQEPGQILAWIHQFNNPPRTAAKRPRVRDPNQLPLLN